MEDILNDYNLYVYVEPEIISLGFPLDYAIVDEDKKKILVMVELKRLSSIGKNFIDYTKSFVEQIGRLQFLNESLIVAYHLHFTYDVLSTCTAQTLVHILSGLKILIESITGVRILSTYTTSPNTAFSEFKAHFKKEIYPLIIEALERKQV